MHRSQAALSSLLKAMSQLVLSNAPFADCTLAVLEQENAKEDFAALTAAPSS